MKVIMEVDRQQSIGDRIRLVEKMQQAANDTLKALGHDAYYVWGTSPSVNIPIMPVSEEGGFWVVRQQNPPNKELPDLESQVVLGVRRIVNN